MAKKSVGLEGALDRTQDGRYRPVIIVSFDDGSKQEYASDRTYASEFEAERAMNMTAKSLGVTGLPKLEE